MSKQAELKRIYEKIDSKIKKNKEALVGLAKKLGYETFGEYVHIEYKTRTAQSIFDEMKTVCVIPQSVSYIWMLTSRIDREIRDYLDGITPKPKNTVIKICYECQREKVPLGNHALCRSCDLKRQQAIRTGGYQETDRHIANGYFF